MSSDTLIGLIPAAGRGVRAYPYTATVPKAMLEVDGVPLIRRNVELLRDELDIRDICVVVGYRGEVIRDYLGTGGALGVRLFYVTNPRVELNLPYSMLLGGQEIARRGLEGYCCTVLSDECYVGSNHRSLLASGYRNALATCGLVHSDFPKQIRNNYVVTIEDGRIVAMQEKPQTVSGTLMGTGTYLLAPEVFTRLAASFADGPDHGPRDWTTWLGGLCAAGARVVPFPLTGRYVNVNSRDDLNWANYLVRDATFASRTASLVYVIEDEGETKLRALGVFAAAPELAEVVAVAPRSSPALERAAGGGKIRLVVASHPGAATGDLVRLGIAAARGDIVILCYSDDTFVPTDVAKFLVYLRDADMVVGTRTTRQMIEQGTNMRGIVRAAHVTLAKLCELLWWRFDSRFTDICCVYRGFWRSTYESISDRLTSHGPEIFPEMVIEVLRARKRIIEIPVNYCNRDLEHSRVYSRYQSVGLFLRVVGVLVRKRLDGLWSGRRWHRRAAPRAVTAR
ncbi:MAG TPA: sugar phosphate nucleotidyltransferase [Candidatus Binatia bacterium]|nr:sugar phosphate nucleotidyltransferase [Candidatus Binatia bacterium]